jgi:ABC-type sulfate transport system substrate-binding protein
VLIAWENEAHLLLQEMGAARFEIVTPSLSILGQPTVSLVDGNVDKEGKWKVAEAYLDFLYTAPAQAAIARNFYRPARPQFADKADLARFPSLKLVTIEGLFGGWAKAQAEHFADGGVLPQRRSCHRVAVPGDRQCRRPLETTG